MKLKKGSFYSYFSNMYDGKGWKEVDGYYSGHIGAYKDWKYWKVIHIPTGLCLHGKTITKLNQARAYIESLLLLSADYSRYDREYYENNEQFKNQLFALQDSL